MKKSKGWKKKRRRRKEQREEQSALGTNRSHPRTGRKAGE